MSVQRIRMIGGPNGSGKSAILALLHQRNVPLGMYLNADGYSLTEVVAMPLTHSAIPGTHHWLLQLPQPGMFSRRATL